MKLKKRQVIEANNYGEIIPRCSPSQHATVDTMHLVQTVLLSSSKNFYGDIIKNVPSATDRIKST